MKTETQPAWQKISGLNPDTEQNLPAEQRDAGIRKLVSEVERLAKIEFDRGDKVPQGERTLFWDPLARICVLLSISRTKLSAYSRELTGMRAHELTDRIKAATLASTLLPWIQQQLDERNAMFPVDLISVKDPQYCADICHLAVKWVRAARLGTCRGTFAAAMGYANVSRIQRACLLAHNVSLDEFERRLVCTLVQKFLEEKQLEARTLAQNYLKARAAQKVANGEPELPTLAEISIKEPKQEPQRPIWSPESQQIIKDAIARVMAEDPVTV